MLQLEKKKPLIDLELFKMTSATKPRQLSPMQQTKEVVTEDNYTKEEIEVLFNIGKWTAFWNRRKYKEKAKTLFDLGLSFLDSRYLLQTKRLSVDDIVRCIRDCKLDVGDFMRLQNIGLTVSDIQELLKGERADHFIEALRIAGNVSNLKKLLNIGLTVSDIRDISKDARAEDLLDDKKVDFILRVNAISNETITDENTALRYFEDIFNQITWQWCESFIDYTKANTFSRNNDDPSGDEHIDSGPGYDDILIHYMGMASDETLVYAAALPVLFKFIAKVTERSNNCNVLKIKPFILAAIWVSMMVALQKCYSNNMEENGKEDIARTVLAFITASLCGVTGYFHSGGAGLPFPNFTNMIACCFKIQRLIEKKAPKIYGLIPSRLKIPSAEAFERLSEDTQVDTGRALSMLYTFRVGNAFLCCVLEENELTNAVKNLFRSLWPLPQEAESMRMYFLYGGVPVYSKLNLKDVFVSIR